MVAAAAGVYWMQTDSAFELAAPEGSGELHYTDPQQIVAAAGLASGHPNVVGLRTAEMRRAILDLHSIADADVRVILPNRVIISVTERTPVLAIRRGESFFLVDTDGLVLADANESDAAGLGLPTINDDRQALATDVHVGGELDPIDLAAMLQLGALTPQLIGSAATALHVSVADDDGYVLSADPTGWQAVFGNYTPTLRPPDLIPRQVQCLRSLLGGGDGEATIEKIYLAPLDERCGTFLPRTTPGPSPSGSPAGPAGKPPRESPSPQPPA